MSNEIQVRVKDRRYYNPDSGGHYKPGTILMVPASEYYDGHAQLELVDETPKPKKGGAKRGLKKG